MTFTLTDEQREIESTAKLGGSMMIKAYAGCAKTTSLGIAAKQIKVPSLALAFNKSIATELSARFPPNFEVKTMNGLGFGALRQALPRVDKWVIDSRKLGKIISVLAKDRKQELSEEQWDMLRRLVTSAMTAGLVPSVPHLPDREGLVLDSDEVWQELADDCWIPKEDYEYLREFAHAVLVRNNEQTLDGLISFDDQVYWPTLHGARFPQFPVMCIDEAQDLNALNHAMLRAAMRPNGRLIVCGDPKQSIYGFRGSVTESMSRLASLKDSWQTRSLTETFRCPQVVVERQQTHAPGFRAAQGNRPGRYSRWRFGEWGESGVKETTDGDGWNWGTIVEAMASPDASCAVLCRNNGPLLGLAFRLLRSGIGVVMLGRDIGKGLIALAKKIGSPDDSADMFMAKLVVWEESESSAAKANGHEERVSSISDRAECLRAVVQGGGARDVQELCRGLELLFSREAGLVTLSTIHRSKGLEWDLVLHLDPWRVPSRQARKAAIAGDSSMLEQEMNLRYVCETRTRNVLIEASLEDYSLD